MQHVNFSNTHFVLATSILLIMHFVMGHCEQYMEEGRQSRFITFNNDATNIRAHRTLFKLTFSWSAFEHGSFIMENEPCSKELQLNLEMVFAIPFLQIPIGQSEGSTGILPAVDVNIKSLIVAGVALFFIFFVVPGLIKVALPNSHISRGWENSEATRWLEKMETSLDKYGINSDTCLNDGMCYVLHTAKDNVLKDRASSWDKIIDGISSSSWIHSVLPVNLTPVSCSTNYTCPLMDYNVNRLFKLMQRKITQMNFLPHLS